MERPDAWRLTDRVTHEFGKGDPFAAAVRATRMAMIITDPRQPDNPIVFANDAFLTLTGYSRVEVMGTNCRFLQGEETDREAVRRVAEAIEARRDINIDLLNYRKDGSSFWNALYVSPVFSDAGELQYFFASQLDVTERMDLLAAKTALLREVDHRVKNNLQMISGFIYMQSRGMTDPQARQTIDIILGRLTTMSAVHQRLYQAEDVTRFSVAEFVPDVINSLMGTIGRDDISVHLDLDPVNVSADRAAPLALIINELTTNVFKHALPPGKPGRLTIRAKRNGDRLRIEVEDNGRGMPAQSLISHTSFGQKLTKLLARQLHATLTWSGVEPSGTRAIIDFPAD